MLAPRWSPRVYKDDGWMLSVLLANARHLPFGRSQAGDYHFKFYDWPDKLLKLFWPGSASTAHGREPRSSERGRPAALMARIGHASARPALRYEHVIDGQDADIVAYVERLGNKPPQSSHHREDPSCQDPVPG